MNLITNLQLILDRIKERISPKEFNTPYIINNYTHPWGYKFENFFIDRNCIIDWLPVLFPEKGFIVELSNQIPCVHCKGRPIKKEDIYSLIGVDDSILVSYLFFNDGWTFLRKYPTAPYLWEDSPYEHVVNAWEYIIQNYTVMINLPDLKDVEELNKILKGTIGRQSIITPEEIVKSVQLMNKILYKKYYT